MTAPAVPTERALIWRVVERELQVYRRTWQGNVFTLFLQPLLFLGAMGFGLGGLVDERSPTDLGGISYLEFIAPGLLVASALLSTAAESLWPVMGGVKWMGQFKGMVATAIGPGHVYGGFVVWAGLRAAMAAVPFLAIAALFGAVPSPWAVLAVVPAVLVALATSAALASFSVRQEHDNTFPIIMRLGVIPLFLFSGTFFPVSQLPAAIEPVVWLSPLFHAVEPARMFTTGDISAMVVLHLGVLAAIVAAAWPTGVRGVCREVDAVNVQTVLDQGRIAPPIDARARFLRMTERNVVGYIRYWKVFLTGIAEPILYLLSIGIGVGALVGDVQYAGRAVPYDAFVASGMLATAAMNGAVFDTTFNFFIRLKYAKLYDAILATPLEPRDVAWGEVTWALMRGTFYAAAFLFTMLGFGLIESWWGILALPATVLIGAAFASIGLAAGTYLRSFIDFDFVNLALTPMFLFSATFFPLSEYPDGVAAVVRWTPLYQGVALCRALTLGEVELGLLVHVAYLAAMVLVGIRLAGRRIDVLLRT